ncbi:hypothetical protein PINS_up003285 [Pythium insidiosum]|nr:hypothetical protein PINS_up003285 [Pythium insidiosum]
MAGLASLVVDIKEARGLLAGDLNGYSDPYVRLTLLDGRGNVIRGSPMLQTKVQNRTLDPTWNESFSLGTRRDGVDLRVVTTLRFMIYDYDGLLRKDTLGVVDIPVDVLLPLAEHASTTSTSGSGSGSEAASLDDWFRVAQFRPEMSKDASGELHLGFRWVPEGTSTSTLASTPSAVDGGGPPNLLFVTVESGRDLLPMDANNSSDPFVKLSIVGQKFHTATIQKTLKPHWDERFAFLLADAHQTLEILVEDEDPTINDFPRPRRARARGPRRAGRRGARRGQAARQAARRGQEPRHAAPAAALAVRRQRREHRGVRREAQPRQLALARAQAHEQVWTDRPGAAGAQR